MMIKVAVPNRFQLKTVSRFRTVLMPGQGEVHYIGGADIYRHLWMQEKKENDRYAGNRRGWESPFCPDRA